MTSQEQAAHVIKAATQARCLNYWLTVNYPPCHPSDPDWNGCHLCVKHAGDATAIRAAVDLVLPEEPNTYTDSAFRRMITRAQFLAIADAMEPPTDA